MQSRVSVCMLCPHLAASRTQTVFGVGNPDADLMFIGEAPGADEDRQGEPFVGRAGQLLTRIIGTMGLGRSDVYIANILKCRPDMPRGVSGNRPPTPVEMQTCLPYLAEQIDIIQPRVLVALGATAVEGLARISRHHARSSRKMARVSGHPAHDYLSSLLLVAEPIAPGKAQGLGRHAPGHGTTRTSDQRKTAQLFLVINASRPCRTSGIPTPKTLSSRAAQTARGTSQTKRAITQTTWRAIRRLRGPSLRSG